MTQLKKLLEPGKIGNLELKNRLVFPPMATRLFTPEGEVTERLIDYYLARVRGGVGLIVLEATYVRAGGYKGRICLDDDRFIPQMKKLVDTIHREGAKIVCQVNVHRGRADEHDPASPSNVPHPYTKIVPRVLTIDDIRNMVNDFGRGMRRVREAGLDGLMIHGASGYLISEFLSPFTNKRTDEYGGSLENRARFALEVVESTRRNVGPDFPIIYRLIGDDRVGGFQLKDALVVARMLEEKSVDAIDVTSGFVETDYWAVPVMQIPPACNVPYSQAIKGQVKVPVIVAGKINDPFLAEQVLAEGKADFIDMGRSLLADPLMVKKAIEGKPEDMCKCIGCSRCSEAVVQTRIPIWCSVNPAVGREREFAEKMKPAARRKKVLVIGGGIAGMEAAVLAAQRGHKVTLWEASRELGGVLNLAILPPGKGDLNYLLNYLLTQLKKPGVDVVLGKEATVATVQDFAPEAVVVAVGASTFTPDIPGIDGKNVTDYAPVMSGQKKVGQKVIVMGGGLVGAETAEFLAEKGKNVTLVFRKPELNLGFGRVTRFTMKSLNEKKVKIVSGVKEYKQITPQGIQLVDKEGKPALLEADDIVLATGNQPNRTLAQSLKDKVPEVYEAGDCIEARRILEAVREGADAASQI
ncbi:MAG: FAD-dependent oxidoreductase [Chloroflexi bacterium]|nr:FAD-dependent oxidoreductase [Chloroflexota bacterium]